MFSEVGLIIDFATSSAILAGVLALRPTGRFCNL